MSYISCDMSVKAHDSQLNSCWNRNKTFLADEDTAAVTSSFTKGNSFSNVLCSRMKREIAGSEGLWEEKPTRQNQDWGRISAILLWFVWCLVQMQCLVCIEMKKTPNCSFLFAACFTFLQARCKMSLKTNRSFSKTSAVCLNLQL